MDDGRLQKFCAGVSGRNGTPGLAANYSRPTPPPSPDRTPGRPGDGRRRVFMGEGRLGNGVRVLDFSPGGEGARGGASHATDAEASTSERSGDQPKDRFDNQAQCDIIHLQQNKKMIAAVIQAREASYS